MTEGNSNAWENWERNTEESHEYADFILKELESITSTDNAYNRAEEYNVQAVYNELLEPEIEYKKPETPKPENLPELQQIKPQNSCTDENSKTNSNQDSVPVETSHDKQDSPKDKNDSPAKDPQVDQVQVDNVSVPENGKKTVNRKRKYQKRKSSTSKRRKPAGKVSRKKSEPTRNPTPKESEPNQCTAPIFSNTDSSDDEVTIPESLIEDKPLPNETESEKSNPSNKEKATRKRNSPESDSQKSAEIGFIRRSSRQSVPPTEVYQSFQLSPKRKPVLIKDPTTKNPQLEIEINPEVQESIVDENRPIKTSEEESTFDTNCPPPPFVCVTDTDSDSSDPGSPNPPRVTKKSREYQKRNAKGNCTA